MQKQEMHPILVTDQNEFSENVEQWDTLIRPATGRVPLELGELWENRELLYFFIWRNIKVRYKQTVLGGAWAIIQPFLTMVVFSIVFGRLAGISSEGVAYPLFASGGHDALGTETAGRHWR